MKAPEYIFKDIVRINITTKLMKKKVAKYKVENYSHFLKVIIGHCEIAFQRSQRAINKIFSNKEMVKKFRINANYMAKRPRF